MPTTTNYGWTTPADTDLVKDGASAIRTLGTSIDTTTKNLNPSTTLGDIEYRSSTSNTNTRLAIGSNGQVLTVSGGVPAWSAPSTGALTVIKAATSFSNVANTGTTFDDILSSSYDTVMVVINDFSTSANTDDLLITFLQSGTEVTSNYYGGFVAMSYTTRTDSGSNATSSLTISPTTGASSWPLSGVFYINNRTGRLNIHGTLHTGADQYGVAMFGGTNLNSAATNTGIRLKSSSGNVTGTVTVYGLAKS